MKIIHDASTASFEAIKATTYLKSLDFRIAEYEKVIRYINDLKEVSAKKYIKTLVPIVTGAHEFLVDAKVPKNTEIKVCVGCGIFVQMSIREAQDFLFKRLETLRTLSQSKRKLLQ